MSVGIDRATRASVMAFVAAFVTLLTQVLVHRIVAAKLLTNYAFLVVSLTMLGFAASGVILARWIDRFVAEENRFLALASVLFVLTLVGATWAFCQAPTWAQVVTSRPAFVRGFFLSLPLALLYALPFTLCGLILGFLLAAPGLPVQRTYFFDLVGSAAGAVAAIPVVTHLGAERGLALGAALLLVTAAVLWSPRGAVRWAFLPAAAALGFVFARPDIAFEMRYEQPGRAQQIEYAAWDAVARIEVSPNPPSAPPAAASARCLTGEDPRFTSLFRKVLTQNNWAGTMALSWDGQPDSLAGIETTIYGAAYQASLVPAPRVAIVGVGAGMDVLNAIHYGASAITGVEVNAATVDIVTRVQRDYFRHWAEDPRLHLVVDDGRSYLAGRKDTYDIIQISGVDSFAGTAASPHIFSENYLYTAEAFDLYLSRLTEPGILNVMRFEHEVPQAMVRVLVTAVGALRRAGVMRPAEHIVTLTTDDSGFTALLVKKTPFTRAELEKVWKWVGLSHTFGVSAAPGLVPQEHNVLSDFLALGDEKEERRFVARYPFDISPTADDWPFFFRYSFWWHVFPESGTIWRFVPVMEYSLILLFGLVGSATLALVYLPMRWLRKEGVPPTFGCGVFFAALGIGFMAVEIAFLQKCGWLLGHPNYGLSVVLATLLLSTGLGSSWSPAVVAGPGRIRFVAYALSALILTQYFLIFPLLPRCVGWPFAAKVAVVVGVVSPPGLLMGAFLPWGLSRLRPVGSSLVPWAWGVNGIFSVLGPLLSVGFSMTWGATALLLSAVPVYLVAGLASASIERMAVAAPSSAT